MGKKEPKVIGCTVKHAISLKGFQYSQAEGREAYELAWNDYVTRAGRSNEEIKSLWLEVEDTICSNFLNSQQTANNR